jgi:protein gp37
VSEGCRNCYAEAVAVRFSKPGQPYHGFAKVTAPRDHLDAVGGRRNGWTRKVELVEKHLADPLHWRKPKRIFVNSMSDLFHESLPPSAIAAVFGVMAAAPQHTFQILTKRPKSIASWMRWLASGDLKDAAEIRTCTLAAAQILRESFAGHSGAGARGEIAWPLPNVWLGVSIEDQETADERVPLLLQTPAAVRFVSYEPALGPVSFRHTLLEPDGLAPGVWLDSLTGHIEGPDDIWRGLDWVIIGGESGPGARPFDVAWAYSTVKACRAAGVACFVKQLGALPFVVDRHSALTDHQLVRIALRPGAFRYERHGGLYAENDGHGEIRDLKGGEWSEWPADLKVREFPNTKGAGSTAPFA